MGVAKQASDINKSFQAANDNLDKMQLKTEIDSPLGQGFKRFSDSIDTEFSRTWRDAFSLDRQGSIFKTNA